jgi:hypothetical protein
MGFFRDMGKKAEKLKQEVSDAARQEALYQCRECGTAVYTERDTCPECGSEALEANADAPTQESPSGDEAVDAGTDEPASANGAEATADDQTTADTADAE